MAKIYTSYYAKFNEFDKDKFFRIQISRYAPIECDSKLMAIMPSVQLLHKAKSCDITPEEYDKQYRVEVDKVIPKLAKYLEHMANVSDKDIVLFCYETSDKHCHRHLISSYVNDYLGYKLISEYEFS